MDFEHGGHLGTGLLPSTLKGSITHPETAVLVTLQMIGGRPRHA